MVQRRTCGAGGTHVALSTREVGALSTLGTLSRRLRPSREVLAAKGRVLSYSLHSGWQDIGRDVGRTVGEAASGTLVQAGSTLEPPTPGMSPLCSVIGHRAPVYCCTFDRTGQRLATGSDDANVKIWDTRSGLLQHSANAH